VFGFRSFKTLSGLKCGISSSDPYTPDRLPAFIVRQEPKLFSF